MLIQPVSILSQFNVLGSPMVVMNACFYCNVKQKDLQACGNCQAAFYCSREHQKKDWKQHKKVCKKKEQHTTPKSALEETLNELSLNNSSSNSREHNTSMQDQLVEEYDVINKLPQESIESNSHASNPQHMPQWITQNSVNLTPYDVVTQRDLDIVNTIVKNLKNRGISVIDNFLKDQKGNLCWHDVDGLRKKEDIFQPGQVIQSGKIEEKIRGDKVVWLSGTEDGAENLNFLFKKMDLIVSKCSKYFPEQYSIMQRTKAMLSWYPANGASYLCHIDNPSGDGRCITALYYLNKGWDAKKYGGVLQLYSKMTGKIAKVEPKFDRLLLFYSDKRNPHEVLPAYAERFAITIWYFDEEERSKALKAWADKFSTKVLSTRGVK